MKPLATASAWRVSIEIALWRHGWAVPLAAIVLGAAAALYFGALRPGRHAIASLGMELAQKQQAMSAATGGVRASAVQSEQQRLQALQAVLRQSPEAGEIVRKMVALAEAEQIKLVQSDYKGQLHRANQVNQIQITQPVRATYPQLRNYIESVLRAVPNVSLDQIVAKRDNVGQSQVQARLKWSIWFQAGAPTASNQEQVQ